MALYLHKVLIAKPLWIPPIRPNMSLFHEGGRGQEKTTLSLLKNVTISLGGVGVKVNLDNVTKYDVFLF